MHYNWWTGTHNEDGLNMAIAPGMSPILDFEVYGGMFALLIKTFQFFLYLKHYKLLALGTPDVEGRAPATCQRDELKVIIDSEESSALSNRRLL